MHRTEINNLPSQNKSKDIDLKQDINIVLKQDIMSQCQVQNEKIDQLLLEIAKELVLSEIRQGTNPLQKKIKNQNKNNSQQTIEHPMK